MGLVYLGAIVAFWGFRFILLQQSSLDSTQRASDARAAAQALYTRDLQTWAYNSAQYQLCLDSVSRSDLNRQQWADIADGLDELGANDFAERVRNGPVLSSQPREPEDCVEPGPAPVAPGDDPSAVAGD
jgi:hypothetical protein